MRILANKPRKQSTRGSAQFQQFFLLFPGNRIENLTLNIADYLTFTHIG